MPYADIAVTCRTSRFAGSFLYAVPPGLALRPGLLVWIPFGQRLVQGVVLDLVEQEPPFPTKDVEAVADAVPVLLDHQVRLARWIADHYCCSLGVVVAQMLPAELRQKATPLFALAPTPPPADLGPRGLAILGALAGQPRTLAELQRVAPGREGYREIRALVARGVVVRSWSVERPRIKPKTERMVRLCLTPSTLPAALQALARAPRQAAVLSALAQQTADGSLVSAADLSRRTGATPAVLAALVRHGYVEIIEREVKRAPVAALAPAGMPLPVLTPAQAAALATIVQAMRREDGSVLLLHGVTGSGKGEVYLHALAAALRLGRQAIVLVPEIALTAQTVRRFAARFGDRVAVLHSGLSPGEHYDEWRRIRDGAAQVVIGSRSAILAPLPRPGLIVVDEEHEWSYKQTERDPRYHARDVAVALGSLTGAAVVLGSATPDVATYQRARDLGAYSLVELPERVEGGRARSGDGGEATRAAEMMAPPPAIPLPAVRVVDLRAEAAGGAGIVFGRLLRRGIAEALAEGSQVILYLNRRGTATFVLCRACGFVAKCHRCDVPLVYHADRSQLLCHHCNRTWPMPDTCPDCWARQVGYFGLGTQRVEAEVRRLFPKARVVRWDRDTTRGRGAHGRILERFLRGEADILVGTQMIAKGLDLPQVALVGVVLADVALQLPDFRASERTFQLLMQVAGRAGRGSRPGRVIIQTYNPDHYGIQAASRHDYGLFYEQEVRFRAAHRYPPFADLARLVYAHANEARCRLEIERLASHLRDEIERRGLPDLEVIGPAPAFRRRLRGRYRWHLLVRGGDFRPLFQSLALPPGWALDVDPISLL